MWLDPPVAIHPEVAEAIRSLDAVVIGPGSFFTSLLPIFLVDGCREALAEVQRPDHLHREPADRRAAAWRASRLPTPSAGLTDAIGRPIDVVIFNSEPPSDEVLERYAAEHKAPLALGNVPATCQRIEGAFWRRPIARHDRSRLRAAVWAALVDQL